DACTFRSNQADNVGGAISNAFGAITNITNTTFESNTCNGTGGALFSQNDENIITVKNSTFISNEGEFGGAIGMNGDNAASEGLTLPVLNLEQVSITANFALRQAGGINITNANANLENVLLDLNLPLDDDGVGGGISFNTNDSIAAVFNIINSTIIENTASLGAGIANWKFGELSTSTLTVQNTIFANPEGDGNNYVIEAGDPVFVSNGGNLSANTSMEMILTGPNDLNDVGPQFVDPSDFNYQLMNESPCVDQGIADGAPPTDLLGNPRVGEPDIGAYENQMMVNTEERHYRFGQLTLFPNPVENQLNYNFSTIWRGQLTLQISDAAGKVVHQEVLTKSTDDLQQLTDVSQLPAGTYQLSLSNGRLYQTQSFIKQ
ncbi:MAG: T9SS type A sorting domain-containing protein, partial [Bacteroidota bacterium]